MPVALLKTIAAAANGPPTRSSQPVRGSLRRRRLAAAIATAPTTPKPSSQPTWPPTLASSRRTAPLVLPVAEPSSRDTPLYPPISDQTLLSDVPLIHGLSAAGVSATASGQA